MSQITMRKKKFNSCITQIPLYSDFSCYVTVKYKYHNKDCTASFYAGAVYDGKDTIEINIDTHSYKRDMKFILCTKDEIAHKLCDIVKQEITTILNKVENQ